MIFVRSIPNRSVNPPRADVDFMGNCVGEQVAAGKFIQNAPSLKQVMGRFALFVTTIDLAFIRL
jgi:hypothetical protein